MHAALSGSHGDAAGSLTHRGNAALADIEIKAFAETDPFAKSKTHKKARRGLLSRRTVASSINAASHTADRDFRVFNRLNVSML